MSTSTSPLLWASSAHRAERTRLPDAVGIRTMSPPFSLRLISQPLAIVRRSVGAGLPWWVANSEAFLSFTRTPEETSIVCDDRSVPEGVQAERGFRALRVEDTLSFSATGVLASIAQPLADAGVSIFVISTFDTDYVLVREASLDDAVRVLREAGHTVSG